MKAALVTGLPSLYKTNIYWYLGGTSQLNIEIRFNSLLLLILEQKFIWLKKWGLRCSIESVAL